MFIFFFFSLQQGFQPVVRSSLSSSPSEFSSTKGNGGGRDSSGEEDSERKTKRANDAVDGGSKGDDTFAGRGEEGRRRGHCLSITGSSSKSQIPLVLGWSS